VHTQNARFNMSQNAYRKKLEGLECFLVPVDRMNLNDFLWKVTKNHSPVYKFGINLGLLDC
jgi:hypothetical protein